MKHLIFFLLFFFCTCSSDASNLYPPTIWNLQYESKELILRKNILNKLKNSLEKTTNSTSQITIAGLPGMGKTQLAKQYANVFNKNYSIVWWFDGTTDIDFQFLCFAKELNKAFHGSHNMNIDSSYTKEIINQAKDFLRTTTEPWLLIFDNVDSLDDIEKFFPEHQQPSFAHIIITSRNINYWKTPLCLKGFLEPESVELIEKITQHKEKSLLINLSKALHNYPIVVSSVAHAIKNSSLDCEKFLNTLTSNKNANNIIDVANRTLQYQIDYLKISAPKAYRLLLFSSFLQNEFIPEEVLECWFEQNNIGTKEEFTEAIGFLFSYCFFSIPNTNYITRGNYKNYTMHSVIQDIIKQKTSLPQTKKILKQASFALTNVVSKKGKQVATPEFVYIFPQIMHIAEQARNGNLAEKHLVALKLEMLEYYQLVERDYGKCIDFIGQHFLSFQNTRACHTEWCSRFKTDFSGILWWQGKHKEGSEQQEIATHFYEKNKIISHEYIRGLLYSASHYSFSGEADLSSKMLQKAKYIMHDKNNLHENKLFTWFNEALFYQNLAANLVLNGKPCEAKKEFTKALALIDKIEKQFLKTKKPFSLYVHFLIQEEEINALVGKDQMQLNSLLDLHKQAVLSFNSKNHRIPAMLLLLIGSKLNFNGNTILAKPYVENCINILDNWFGKNNLHKTQAQARIALGDIYISQNLLTEALDTYLFAEKIYSNCYTNMKCADISILYEKIATTAMKMKNDLVLRKYIKKHEQTFGKENDRTKKLAKFLIL